MATINAQYQSRRDQDCQQRPGKRPEERRKRLDGAVVPWYTLGFSTLQ